MGKGERKKKMNEEKLKDKKANKRNVRQIRAKEYKHLIAYHD